MVIYGFLKNGSKEQPYNIFLQNAIIKSMGIMPLAHKSIQKLKHALELNLSNLKFSRTASILSL